MEKSDISLERLGGILIRSFFMGYALLILWFLLFAFGTDSMYRLHSEWFEMSRTSFHIVHYCGMGLMKIILIVFFLFPYLSIKIVSRKKD